MKKIIIPAILISGALLSLLPFLWMLVTSLKPGSYSLSISFDTLFAGLSVQNYKIIWEKIPLITYTKNSLIISISTIIGTVFSSSFVAYAFSILFHLF